MGLFTNFIEPAAGLSGGTKGGIIQIRYAIKTNVASTSSLSFVDISGLSISITPTRSDSQILVTGHISGDGTQATTRANYRVKRTGGTGTAYPAIGDAYGNRTRAIVGIYQGADDNTPVTSGYSFIDDTNTTNQVTYTWQFSEGNNTGSSVYVNRSSSWSDSIAHCTASSSIIVMEISA